jgi:hypothetical protein
MSHDTIADMTEAQPQSHSHTYDEYFSSRVPLPIGQRMIRFWTLRLFENVSTLVGGFRNREILEVGPGFGDLAMICKEKKIAYSALEQNASQVEKLRTAGISCQQARIPPFPTGPELVVIWMAHVLENAVHYLDAREMAAGALGQLTRGGLFVVIAPDFYSWKAKFFDTDWSHGFPTTKRRVGQLLRDVGFEVLEERHHIASVTNRAFVPLLNFTMKFIPVTLLDFIFSGLFRRTLATSFMSIFGWRQILVIGKKP